MKDLDFSVPNLKKFSEITSKIFSHYKEIIEVFHYYKYFEYNIRSLIGSERSDHFNFSEVVFGFLIFLKKQDDLNVKEFLDYISQGINDSSYIHEMNIILRKYSLWMMPTGRIVEFDNQESNNSKDSSIEDAITNDSQIHQKIKDILLEDRKNSLFVLEGIKPVFQYIREKTGLKEDGMQLCQLAFSPNKPYLLLYEDIGYNVNHRNEHNSVTKRIESLCSLRNILADTQKTYSNSELVHILREISILIKSIEKMYVVPRYHPNQEKTSEKP